MKSKTLFVFLTILTIILLISFLPKKKTVKIEPAPEEEQTKLRQSDLLSQETDKAQPAVKNKKRSAITIIKPPVEENPLFSEEKLKKINQPKKKPTTTNKTSESSAQQPETPSKEPTAGITEEGIRKPSAEEQKEMNARGIIMW